jgi:hypothetical protein
MKVQRFVMPMRAAAIVGAVTALLLLMAAHAGAQVAGVNSLVSVCVNQSTGAMRMLLKASADTANCSAGEQFIQWLVQTPPGTQHTAEPRAFDGSKGGERLRQLAGCARAADMTVGVTFGDNGWRRELVAYSEPQGSDDGNQAQATEGNSGANAQPDQRGAFTSKGELVPPKDKSGDEQTNFTGQVDVVYAPFQVRDRTTNKVLAQIINNGGKGGRLQLFDASGALIATIGTSQAGTGGVAVLHSGGLVGLGFRPGARYGTMQILGPDRVRVAELGSGNKDQMGLRIFNPSGTEVVTLEDLAGGFGGGGLMIHNAIGGSAATIAPNKDGVGIFHGITAVMPINHP